MECRCVTLGHLLEHVMSLYHLISLGCHRVLDAVTDTGHILHPTKVILMQCDPAHSLRLWSHCDTKSFEPALMHIIKSKVLQKLCMRHQMFVKSSLTRKDKQVQEKDSTIIYPHGTPCPLVFSPCIR
jgi:hypothetical protein